MKFSLKLLLAVAAFGQISTVLASEDGCEALLVPDQVSLQKNLAVRYAFSQVISREMYNQMSGSDGLSIGFGDMFSLGKNYDEFKKSAESRREASKLAWSVDDASTYLFRTVPPAARAHFVKCKENNSSRPGIHTWIVDASGDQYTINIAWRPPAGAVRTVTPQYQHINVKTTNLPSRLESNANYRFVATNAIAKEGGTLIVNAGGYTSSIPFPKPFVDDSPVWCREQLELPLTVTAHVSHHGNDPQPAGAWSGNRSGQSIQAVMIAFADTFPNPVSGLGLEYQCHMAGVGWKPWTSSGKWCADQAEDRRLEAIKIRLTGSPKDSFRLEYFCVLEGYSGAFGPFTDGAQCGTVSDRRELEGLKVSIRSKGSCPAVR